MVLPTARQAFYIAVYETIQQEQAIAAQVRNRKSAQAHKPVAQPKHIPKGGAPHK